MLYRVTCGAMAYQCGTALVESPSSCKYRASLEDLFERIQLDDHAAVLELEVQRQLAEHAHGAEAAPMVRGDAETVNRFAMITGGVAGVLLPAVARVAQRQFGHEPIAQDLAHH